MDSFSCPNPNERQDIRLSPIERWNPEVIAQILGVVRTATASTPESDITFVTVSECDTKPIINTTLILQRAEQDLAASERLVEERRRLSDQPNAKNKIQQQISVADERLYDAIKKLLALGAGIDVIIEKPSAVFSQV